MVKKFKNLEDCKLIPTQIWDTKCFACGINNPEGLKMQFYTDEQRVFSKVYLPHTKRGWDHIVHGGIINTILDEIMVWATIYLTGSIVLTKSMKVDFSQTLHIDSNVKAIAWVDEIKSSREAFAKSEIYSEEDELCAEASSSHALFSKRLAKRMNLMTEESLEKFEKFLEACKK